MRKAIVFALAAALAAACAAPEPKPPQPVAAPAKPACVPPPAELQVTDTRPGTGDTARLRSAVLVHYTGWVYDGCAADRKGEMFDSSSTRGMPISFMVGAGRVIKGWDEGLVGLREGGKRVLVIPPGKAYGARSPTPKIPPNATLVFEVELLKIIQQAPQ